MKFKKYQHVERFGNIETEGIELGKCFIMPKIDGTNASCWLDDGEVKGGSRRRELTLEDDNAGFYAWLVQQENIEQYLLKYPNRRLIGEWLVPHSLKTYKKDAWRRFYVFDVMEDIGEEDEIYIPYDEYKNDLEEYGIDYISPICVINNGSYEQFVIQLNNNVFLIEDGEGVGEG